MAQCLGLCLQILPELGCILIHGSQHGLQSLHLHVIVLDCAMQRGFITTQLAIRDGFQFDGVECVSNSVLDAVIACQFCLISILTDLRIGIICHIAHSRQRDGLAAVRNRHSGGQILLHIAPCRGAGQTQLGSHRLTDTRQQITGRFLHVFKHECIILQIFVALDQLHQVRQLTCPILKGSKGSSHSTIQCHDTAQLRTGSGVLGIGRLAQACKLSQLAHQIGETLLQSNATTQTLNGFHTGQLLHKGSKGNGFLLQRSHIRFECGVVESFINRIQIPDFIHKGNCSFQIHFYHCTPSFLIRQLRKLERF